MTAILCAALAVAFPAADDKDLEKLAGKWQRVSILVDGKETAEADVKKQSLVVKDGSYVLTIGGDMRKGTMKADTSGKPWTIDIIPDSGPNKGKVLKGIWRLEGDKLTYCIAAPDKDRPTSFESKPGSGHSLYINERVKP